MPRRRTTGEQSFADFVRQELRRAILEGALRPGEHLRQEAIAERFKVSRLPVREALQRLVSEGTVVYNHNRGYFVAQMGSEEMRQVYLMRGLLEDELVRTIRLPTEVELTRMEKFNRDIQAAGKNGGIDVLISANRAFHFVLYSCSPLTLVLAEVERLWDLSEQYRTLYVYHSDARRRTVAEHRRLIELLRAGDREGCVELLREHRRASEDEVCRLLRNREERALRTASLDR